MPPLVADFQPFSLHRNLLTFLAVPWATLRGCFAADSGMGVAEEFLQNVDGDVWPYKAVFGLPWDCEQFIRRAVEVGHPGIGQAHGLE